MPFIVIGTSLIFVDCDRSRPDIYFIEVRMFIILSITQSLRILFEHH